MRRACALSRVSALLAVSALGLPLESGCSSKDEAAGGSTSQTVGPAGGIVMSPGGQITIAVPSGAVAADVKIVVTPVASPPAGAVGAVFELGPSGVAFQKPVTLSLQYDEARLAGRPPADLRLATFEGGSWRAVSSLVDATTRTVSAQVEHFSLWGMVWPGPNAPYKIVLSHLSLILDYDAVQKVDATVISQNGTVLTGHTVAWVSSDDQVVWVNGTKVAYGDVIDVQAVGRGTASINATIDGEAWINSAVGVLVPKAPVGKVVLTSPTLSVLVYGTMQVTMKVLDPRGHDITAGRLCSWSSSNTSVASVDDDGVVRGLSMGVAEITATCEGVVGSLSITVGDASPADAGAPVDARPPCDYVDGDDKKQSCVNAYTRRVCGLDGVWKEEDCRQNYGAGGYCMAMTPFPSNPDWRVANCYRPEAGAP